MSHSFNDFLAHLTTESTIADLPYWELSLSDDEPCQRAAEAFEKNPKLPGLLIFNETGYRGMISREKLYNRLGRRFGVEIFLNRPIKFMMDLLRDTETSLDHGTPIRKAAEVCLSREGEAIYEAIVVTFPDHAPRLVGFRDLILAQTRLLALASSAKDQFLATMSHELKTPLTSIIGYSEIVKDDLEEAEEYGSANLISKLQVSAKQLMDLIESILDLSKIETGGMDLRLETFDILPLLDEVKETILPLAKKNHNVLSIVSPDNIGSMHADRFKVRQNLLNLLSNACKFTKNGKVSLTVSLMSSLLVFTIQDSGIGMTPEQMEKVFDPFVQADSSTTRKYGGTGLGLTITRRFCELMHGSVTVQSKIGEGTSFIMSLPSEVFPILRNGQTVP